MGYISLPVLAIVFSINSSLIVDSASQAQHEYKGCYEDRGKSSLVNELKKTDLASLAPDVCIQFCASKKFSFAGLQKAECRCGNHVPSDILKTTNDECKTTCPGHKSHKCGGKNKISVYTTGVKLARTMTTRNYLGCYKDANPEFRLLKGSWNEFHTDNSPLKCHEHCFKTGFKYFGLTYQKECFCGDTGPSESFLVSDSECDSICTGDKSETCGGGWRLAVYETGITDFPEIGRLVGCFKNLRNTEVKYTHLITLSKSNSNRRCVNICYIYGYKFSGVINRTECTCSNSLPVSTFVDDVGNCEKDECPGDVVDRCGSPNRVKIYRTRLTDAPAEESINLGCYEDNVDYRILGGPKVVFEGDLTPTMCVNVCKEKGYAFAGLEAGNECFCGHNYPSASIKVEDSECTIPCVGEGHNELCGGLLRMSTYETGLPHYQARTSYSYKGCYKDEDRNNRLLKGFWQQFENTLSPDVCHRFCLKMGFTYFGLTWIKECFCGDEIPPEENIVPESECFKECGGDSNHKCGGGWRLSVYKTGLVDVSPNTAYFGCFENSGALMSDYKIELPTANKPKRCVSLCDQMSFLYAGVQRGFECRCGNQQPSGLAVSDGKCEVDCPGDRAERCGSTNYLGAYRTSVRNAKIVSTPLESDVKLGHCRSTSSSGNNKIPCKYDLIFNEDFNSLDTNIWKHTVKMAYGPDYEFVTYSPSENVTYVKNGILYIKPQLQEDRYIHGKQNLSQCTGQANSQECVRSANFNYILPPVLSGQISTKQTFSFRYGRFDIRAKLPNGDWMIPQIWLTPKDSLYGPNYESGQIRIAMVRGNKDLKCDGSDLGNQVMENGIRVGPSNSVRNIVFINKTSEGWSKNFHNYSLVWKPDNLAFYVDGKLISHILKSPQDSVVELAKIPKNAQYIWKDGSNLAPFDKAFYITLGVSVGGVTDFPNDCTSGEMKKPWANTEAKAMFNFWNKRNEWHSTWDGENAALQVDHVKAEQYST